MINKKLLLIACASVASGMCAMDNEELLKIEPKSLATQAARAYVKDCAQDEKVDEFVRRPISNSTRIPESADITESAKRSLGAHFSAHPRMIDLYKRYNVVFHEMPKIEGRKLRVSPDGRYIAYSPSDAAVALYDREKKTQRKGKDKHSEIVVDLKWAPDSKKFVTGSVDGIYVWPVPSKVNELRAEKISESENSGEVRHFEWSQPDELMCFFHSGTVDFYDVPSKRLVRRFANHPVPLGLHLSQKNPKVVVGLKDNTACIWDTNTGKNVQTLIGHRNAVRAVRFSPDDEKVASGSSDCTVRIWNVETGARLCELRGHTEEIDNVLWSPDEAHVVTASADRTVRLWDAVTGALLYTAYFAQRPIHLSWLNDGMIVVESMNGALHTCDLHKVFSYINTVKSSSPQQAMLAHALVKHGKSIMKNPQLKGLFEADAAHFKPLCEALTPEGENEQKNTACGPMSWGIAAAAGVCLSALGYAAWT